MCYPLIRNTVKVLEKNSVDLYAMGQDIRHTWYNPSCMNKMRTYICMYTGININIFFCEDIQDAFDWRDEKIYF